MTQAYPRTPNIYDLSIPVLALDVVIFTFFEWELCAVTVPAKNRESAGKLVLPGGIIARGESLEEAFDRILLENTGVSGIYKEQLYTFGRPDRDTRGHVVSVTYYALVRHEMLADKIFESRIQLIPLSKVSERTLAYDHSEIVKYARQRLLWKLEYTNIARNILGNQFTLTALQNVYETAMERTFDKRNFRKKILSLGLIRETDNFDSTSSKRPARLYTFVDEDLKLMEKRELI